MTGPDGDGGFVVLAKLDGVSASMLDAFNFSGLDPHDAAAPTIGPGHAPLHAEGPHLYLA